MGGFFWKGIAIRLQVFLAKRGIGSRRHCEILIRQGRVQLNGTVVREMGVQIDPTTDTVLVDSQQIPQEERPDEVLRDPAPSPNSAPESSNFGKILHGSP